PEEVSAPRRPGRPKRVKEGPTRIANNDPIRRGVRGPNPFLRRRRWLRRSLLTLHHTGGRGKMSIAGRRIGGGGQLQRSWSLTRPAASFAAGLRGPRATARPEGHPRAHSRAAF